MTLDQIKDAANRYLFDELLPYPIEEWSDLTTPSPNIALQHCKWMCVQIQTMENIDKAMRWLCFVQGVFWTLNIRSISDMRNDNR